MSMRGLPAAASGWHVRRELVASACLRLRLRLRLRLCLRVLVCVRARASLTSLTSNHNLHDTFSHHLSCALSFVLLPAAVVVALELVVLH